MVPTDITESSMITFHNSHAHDDCIFHTSSERVKDSMLKRNPNCKVQHDGYEYILTYPADEVRPTYMWVKKRDGDEEGN